MSFLGETSSSARRWRPILAALALSATLPWLAACETNPATGGSMLSLMSPEEERRVGAQEHPKLVKAFGGLYEDAELARYIDSIGQLLARTSEMPDLKFTFVVIDSDVVNAFALPGGYVHLTRGLLALANDESEVAGVIAHEIGHVTGRHANQRRTAALGGAAATILGGLLLGNAGAQLGQELAGAGVASYSRDQEFEADSLGVRYLRRAGYDTRGMADFLASLEASSSLEARIAGRKTDGASDRMASHPRTQDRVQAAIREAGGPVVGAEVGRDIYLSKIDGMIYGDSPDNGFVRGTRFAHPGLGFGFAVPQGFRLTNQPDKVVASGPQGAAILFSRAQTNGTPLDYLRAVRVSNSALSNLQAMTVNGMEAATGTLRGNTRQGPADLRVVAIRFAANTVYQFLYLSPASATAALNDGFVRTTNSFHRLSAQEAAALKPLRIQVVTVRPGDTVQSLANRCAFADHKLERFLVLNGLQQNAALRPGQKVKLVVEGDVTRQISQVIH